MKFKFILIIIVSIFFNLSIKAQTGVPDTLAYLKTIVANKSIYIGKTFDNLEKALKIKILFFSPDRGKSYNVNLETGTFLGFLYTDTPTDFSYPLLRIFWKPYLNAGASGALYNKYDGGHWSPEVSTYYSKGIITDIDIL